MSVSFDRVVIECDRDTMRLVLDDNEIPGVEGVRFTFKKGQPPKLEVDVVLDKADVSIQD